MVVVSTAIYSFYRMKPTCLIYGNCQGYGVGRFLEKTSFGYDVKIFQNYRLILKEEDPADLHACAAKADLFIYQPINEKYGELCTEHMLHEVIPKDCRTVSFACQFNSGIEPLIEHGTSILGSEYVKALMEIRDNQQIINAYHGGTVNFGMLARFLACAAEQARREVFCDVPMIDWILNNRTKRLFLTQNHPTSFLFAELARRTISFLSGRQEPEIPIASWNEVGLPCGLPLSRYAVKEFGHNLPVDPEAEDHYKKLLDRILNLR